jgi:GNAT superfamily N-acetyltransferase
MPTLRITDQREADFQLAGGARLIRVAHDMTLDLAHFACDVVPATIPRFRMAALTDLVAAAEASAASTPAGHPDHWSWPDFEARVNYWQRLMTGEVCGSVFEASGLLDSQEHVVGGLVVTLMPETSWWKGGAWIAEVFIVPEHQAQGLGRILMLRGIERAKAVGEPRIGLTVTDGNRAGRLYERLGFKRIRTVYVLEAAHQHEA